MTLIQLDRLRTRFSATPEQAANLRINQQVTVQLVNEKKEISATVERVSPIVDAKSGTIEVHVVMDNSQQALRSGTRCLLEVDESPANGNAMAGTAFRIGK